MSTTRTIPCEKMADAEEFIRYIVKNRGWSDLSNDYIMDIGCGMGIKSTRCLTLKFPHFKKVIGIDTNDCSNGEIFEENFDKIVFQVANIAERETLDSWIGGMTKIISHNCFNCVEDQRTAFENVFDLLTPGGEAAILFTLQADYYDWIIDISQQWPKLSENYPSKKPMSHIRKRRAPYYRGMFKRIGFNVLVCEHAPITYEFHSEGQCTAYLRSICFPLDGVSADMKARFEEDSFDTFMKYAQRNEKGNITMECVLLKAIIEKPNA